MWFLSETVAGNGVAAPKMINKPLLGFTLVYSSIHYRVFHSMELNYPVSCVDNYLIMGKLLVECVNWCDFQRALNMPCFVEETRENNSTSWVEQRRQVRKVLVEDDEEEDEDDNEEDDEGDQNDAEYDDVDEDIVEEDAADWE